MVPLFKIHVEAKIIEPEVVKTEKWTTSYFIDDDMETLYPYVQCEADIYNDGTIKFYMWNTHEWNGFTTYEHNLCICGTHIFYDEDSIPYQYYFGKRDDSGIHFEQGMLDNTILEDGIVPNDINNEKVVNLFLNSFSYKPCSYELELYDCPIPETIGVIGKKDSFKTFPIFIDMVKNISLPKFSEYYSTKNNPIVRFTLKPKTEPIKQYDFKLYGHGITITPELLSGSVIATPEPSEQEKRIAELEEQNKILIEQNNQLEAEIDRINEENNHLSFENDRLEYEVKSLKSQLDSILVGDLNSDGSIDILDAIVIRRFLAGTIEELPYKGGE
jgi:hypothetical protein